MADLTDRMIQVLAAAIPKQPIDWYRYVAPLILAALPSHGLEINRMGMLKVLRDAVKSRDGRLLRERQEAQRIRRLVSELEDQTQPPMFRESARLARANRAGQQSENRRDV